MKIKRVIILLVIIVLAAGSYWFYLNRQQVPADELQLYGNVDVRQVQLAFQESGRLEKLYVQEGDTVKAGTLLAEIDSVRYQANLDKAKAEQDARQQVLDRLLAGSRPQEIAAAQADVRALEAKVADAKVTFNRLQRLVDKKATSQQQVDDAAMAYKDAQERLEAARQALDLARIGPRKEDIAAARARVAAAEAGVTHAEKEVADTRLYAPADAIVRDRIMEPGDMAFPATPVLTLALTNPLWVRTYVPEPDLGKIIPGMKADIITDSYPGKTYRGWIGYISPTAEFTPKTVETPALRTRLVYQTRVFTCNPEDELRLGMPTTVHIDLTQEKPTGKVSSEDVCRENR